MSKMGEYAIERQRELANRRPRKKASVPGNVPTAIRDQQIDAKIAECITQGIDEPTATSLVVQWNSMRASPMKVGLLKKRVYLAYQAQAT